MEQNQLNQHISIFLYPFHYNEERDVFQKINLPESQWQLLSPELNSSEYMFFTPLVQELLFKKRFKFKPIDQIKISYKEIAHKINSIFLTLLPNNIAIISMDINFKKSTHDTLIQEIDGKETMAYNYSLENLLDFNESFRYVADLYNGHRHSRQGLFVESPWCKIENGVTEEWIGCCLNPVFSDVKRLFDERMITFSLAFLQKKPSEEMLYKFFNVDSWNIELPDKEHVQRYLNKNTYIRWRDKGVLYGFTNYSGGCIVWDESKRWLMDNFKHHYCDIAIALYFLFGSLKLFDLMISSSDIRDKKRFLEIKDLFIQFVKDYWHIDITYQDQGRELFHLWKNIIEKEYNLFEKVDHKLKLWRRKF